jgi:hypothetical protein
VARSWSGWSGPENSKNSLKFQSVASPKKYSNFENHKILNEKFLWNSFTVFFAPLILSFAKAHGAHVILNDFDNLRNS